MNKYLEKIAGAYDALMASGLPGAIERGGEAARLWARGKANAAESSSLEHLVDAYDNDSRMSHVKSIGNALKQRAYEGVETAAAGVRNHNQAVALGLVGTGAAIPVGGAYALGRSGREKQAAEHHYARDAAIGATAGAVGGAGYGAYHAALASAAPELESLPKAEKLRILADAAKKGVKVSGPLALKLGVHGAAAGLAAAGVGHAYNALKN